LLVSTRTNAQITGPGTPQTHNICVNESITLVEAVTDGLWSSTIQGVATVNSTGVVTGVSAGTTIITYKHSGGAPDDTYSITVGAPPATPDPISGGASSVCSGAKTAAFIDNNPAGGKWSSDKPLIATVDPTSGIVTGVSTGVANIIYTVTSACGSSSAFTTVAVNNIPNITGTTSICTGSTTTLYNAVAGGVWSSANAWFASIDPATGVVTGNHAGTVVISYTVTNNCGKNAITTSVTVGDPITSAGSILGAGGVNTYCAGTTNTAAVTESASGGVWSSDNSSVASVNSNGDITAIQGGKANILYTISNGCGSLVSAPFPITVNPVINATPAGINGSNTVCAGSKIVLTDFTTGGTWTSANTSAASIDVNGVVTGAAAGTSVIKYTISNGSCGVPASASFNLTVTNCTCITTPSASAITGTATVSAGLQTQLSCTATNGTGAWTSANTNIATVDNKGKVTASTAGTDAIFYTVTNNCGATDVAGIYITVTAAVVPPAQDPCKGLAVAPTVNPAIQCITGNNFTFADHTSNGNPFATGPSYLYNWNFGDGTKSNINTPSHSYTTTGDYDVALTVTDANGCQTGAVLQITVGSVVNAGYNVAFQTSGGSGTTFTSTSSTNAGNLTYLWDFGTGNIANSTSPNPTVYYQPGAYTVYLTVTGSGGCSDQIAQKVDVNNSTVSPVFALLPSAPLAGFVKLNPNDICINATPGSVKMSNPTVFPVGSGWAGSWSSLNTSVATIDASGVITPVKAGDATIVFTATNSGLGQSVKTTTVVTIEGILAAPFINGITNICESSSALFTSNITGGTWSNDPSNTYATVDASGNVTAGNSVGTSVLKYAVSNDCSAPSSTFTVNVTKCCPPTVLDPTKGATSVVVGSQILLTNTTSVTINDGGSGSWASDNSNIASIGGQNNGACWVIGVKAGTANIIFTYTNACGIKSVSSYSVNVTAAAPATPTCTLVASFTPDKPAKCITNSSFQFTDGTSATGTAPYSYTWDFNDGTVTSNTQGTIGGNTQWHTFTKAGGYDVSLVVTDANGCSSNYMVQLTVTPVPTASFQVEYNTGNNGKGITFQSTSSTPSGDLAYLWDFGNSTTSTASSATVYYSSPNTYTVNLTVSDVVIIGSQTYKTCSVSDVLNVTYGGPTTVPVAACPNPASGSSTITLSFTPASTVTTVHAVILDAGGKYLSEQTLPTFIVSGKFNIALDVSKLTSGKTYYVKIFDDNHQLIGVSTIMI